MHLSLIKKTDLININHDKQVNKEHSKGQNKGQEIQRDPNNLLIFMKYMLLLKALVKHSIITSCTKIKSIIRK